MCSLDMDGAADVAETTCTKFLAELDDATVLAHRPAGEALRNGSQLALFAAYSYHGCMEPTKIGETLELDRLIQSRHAEIQNAIRDLKYGVGLYHLPYGPDFADRRLSWLRTEFTRWCRDHSYEAACCDSLAAGLGPHDRDLL